MPQKNSLSGLAFTTSTRKIKIGIFTYFVDNDMDYEYPCRYPDKLSGSP